MEMVKTDKKIYSLPAKVGAVMLSVLFFIVVIGCLIVFSYLYSEGIYSLNDAEMSNYLIDEMRRHGNGDYFRMISAAVEARYLVIVFGFIAGILFLLFLILVLHMAGRRRDEEGIHKTIVSELPLEITTGLYMLVTIMFYGGVGMAPLSKTFGVVAIVVFFGAWCFFTILYLANTVIGIKSETLFKNMLTIRTLKFLFAAVKGALNNISAVGRAAVFFLATVFVEVLILQFTYGSGAGVTVLLHLFLIVLFAYVSVSVKKLEEAGKKIASGDVSYKVDVTYMAGDLKIIGNQLNEIGAGLSNALEEKMKSERLKTELITNVSHDIKTPLTSIINYTDLLKKENIETEPVKGYIEVLDRQSERLKKLINDLLEASKAASGVTETKIMEFDAEVLLNQAIGEYQDKLESANLSTVVTMPEGPVMIKADGRHLWRVFDNILGNTVKYAEPGTRVYMDLIKNGSDVKIIFKNISAGQLNITGEELMERFVRGDSSRNTEGSGLGLSIARSLMELMNGTLKINIDGDLFKAELGFKGGGTL